MYKVIKTDMDVMLEPDVSIKVPDKSGIHIRLWMPDSSIIDVIVTGDTDKQVFINNK